MDSDEFDDDIADEDLIIAASQVPVQAPVQAPRGVQPAKINQGRFQPHVPAQRTSIQRNGSSSAQGISVCLPFVPRQIPMLMHVAATHDPKCTKLY